MTNDDAVRLLATLVHRGLLSAADAKAALAADDPGAALVARGACDAATWQQWVETRAGTRPRLSRYELLEEIGEGGQAAVWRARDKVEDEVVALKILRPELAAQEAAVRAFVQEARTLIELDSAHVVKGRRVAREGATIFFAMELIDGECVQDRLDRVGRLDEEQALYIVGQVAEALDDLRRAGLVHRDVKPGNVMVGRDGHAWLIDLGFATAAAQAAGGTAGDTTAGTVHYIAPEQARGAGDLDVRADIYALGATLYHLVTGSLPFEGASNQDVLAKQVLESLSGDRIRAMDLSPQTHWFIEKMMAKEKEIRFQDPAELRAEIDRFLAQRAREREQEERDDPLARLRRRRRRRR